MGITNFKLPMMREVFIELKSNRDQKWALCTVLLHLFMAANSYQLAAGDYPI